MDLRYDLCIDVDAEREQIYHYNLDRCEQVITNKNTIFSLRLCVFFSNHSVARAFSSLVEQQQKRASDLLQN